MLWLINADGNMKQQKILLLLLNPPRTQNALLRLQFQILRRARNGWLRDCALGPTGRAMTDLAGDGDGDGANCCVAFILFPRSKC